MTLSSAEKHSAICPWRFPADTEELNQRDYPLQNFSELAKPTSISEREPVMFALSLEDYFQEGMLNSGAISKVYRIRCVV